jgi:catechol 2,3-dioxygenase-like lactoylglutathione lyase family enzyme
METARLTLMPLVYVTDMERSIAFYSALGGKVTAKSRSGTWTELRFGDAILALHRTDHLSQEGYPRLELCFVSAGSLEDLQTRLRKDDVQVDRPVTDEAFGFSMTVRDPDGLPIQVNQHDQSLYT